MVLQSLTVRSASVTVAIAGEAGLRRFQGADATVRLGRGYHSIDADLTALAHERQPAADKCTMISPNFQRHLRRNAGPQAPIVGPPSAAVQAPVEEQAAASASQEVPLPDDSVKDKPTGGKLRVKLRVRHIAVPGKTPDLQVTLPNQALELMRRPASSQPCSCAFTLWREAPTHAGDGAW